MCKSKYFSIKSTEGNKKLKNKREYHLETIEETTNQSLEKIFEMEK